MWKCKKCSQDKQENYLDRCFQCGHPHTNVLGAIASKTRSWKTGRKLRSSNSEARKQAVEYVVKAMVRVLDGPGAGMREAQAELITGLGDVSSATADFIAAYRLETDRTRRNGLIIVLGGIGSATAVSFLLDELRAELGQQPADKRNIHWPIEGLAKLKVREAIPLIQEALRTESDSWRLKSLLSHLDKIDSSAGDSERDRSGALSACSTICFSPDEASAKRAAKDLSAVNERLSDEQRRTVIAQLSRGLKETSREARTRFQLVAEVIVNIGGSEAIAIVRAALRGEFKTPGLVYNQELAVAAGRALGMSKDRSNLPELQRALENTHYASDPQIRATLLEAISTLDATAGRQAKSGVDSRLATEAARLSAERERQRAEQAAAIAVFMSNLEGLGSAELIDSLRDICQRWAAGVTGDHTLVARARAIGEVLMSRGGISEMRRAHAALGGIRGARTLEMHWDGIGDWRG